MEIHHFIQEARHHGLIIQADGDKISLSPTKLISEEMMAFAHRHKPTLLAYLKEEAFAHEKRKASMEPGSLDTLRSLLHRNLKPGCPGQSKVSQAEVEDEVDKLLRQYEYDVEEIISIQHSLIPPIVQCSECRYYIPDPLGGGGIGECMFGIPWTQEGYRRIPLYPEARRHCLKYKQKSG